MVMIQGTTRRSGSIPAKPRIAPSNDEISVLAVGVSAGQEQFGVELGSAALLGSGMLERLQGAKTQAKIHHDYTVHTYQEAYDPELVEESEKWSSSNSTMYQSGINNTRNPFPLSFACERISEQVYRQARKGRAALTLGGDHTVSIGTVAGSTRACKERTGKAPALIWVDSQPRIHTPDSSTNGHINGMAVSFLSGLTKSSDDEPFSWLDETSAKPGAPAVEFSKIVYIGLRDIDAVSRRIIKKNHIKAFTMADVHRMGITKVMTEALSYIGGKDTPVHLSFGLGAVDPKFAPSVTMPVPDGLSLNESKHICQRLRSSIVAMDMVELNPVLDDAADNGRSTYETIKTAMSIVESAF